MAWSTGWAVSARCRDSLARPGDLGFIRLLRLGNPSVAADPEGVKKPDALPDGSSRGHRPCLFDLPAADAVELVDHVADDAAVVGHDADHVAHGGALAARGEIDHAVLLRQRGDRGVGMFDHVAEALHGY
jgi:hypothetical protein